MGRVIELPEYQSIELSAGDLSDEVGLMLKQQYADQIEIHFPHPGNDHHWRLRNLGWVGHIPLSHELHLSLAPKTPLRTVFGMLEYAFRLKSFHLLEGDLQSETLDELYERLAHILAQRVLDRVRKGLYRNYVDQQMHLPYVRGRLNLKRAVHKPWNVALDCRFQEHTADVEDNQLLAWALFQIVRSGICTERVLPNVRRAYRALQSQTQLQHFSSQACLNRFYHRLNDDYKPLHGLAYFFLQQQGPTHRLGDRTMVPFLINMARLYESFVSEWLRSHLPQGLKLKSQFRFNLEKFYFDIDLVIEDMSTGFIRWVLDTKYKVAPAPNSDDIAQIGFYAHDQGAKEGVLIYPVPLQRRLDEHSQGVRLRSLTFAIDGDLESAGQSFLDQLLHQV